MYNHVILPWVVQAVHALAVADVSQAVRSNLLGSICCIFPHLSLLVWLSKVWLCHQKQTICACTSKHLQSHEAGQADHMLVQRNSGMDRMTVEADAHTDAEADAEQAEDNSHLRVRALRDVARQVFSRAALHTAEQRRACLNKCLHVSKISGHYFDAVLCKSLCCLGRRVAGQSPDLEVFAVPESLRASDPDDIKHGEEWT